LLTLPLASAWADPPVYAPLPAAATPFADDESPGALLRPPARTLQTTDHQIGFDTREVEIQSYVKADSTLGIDSTQLWATHYGELSDYLADALAASRRRTVHRELEGERRLGDSSQQNSNRYELPVKIPEWAKRLGLAKPALTMSGTYTLQLKANSHWTSQEEAAGTANKFPDFSPEQIPNISLVGNIGKFVSVSLTWNQQGFGATQNQDLHIKYAGEKPEDTEDDILQEAEFGQIQFALPGTSLTGYTEAASGVLGVRAKMRFGDLDLTVMGGTQKGEQQKQHIGRGSKETTSPLFRDRDLDIGYDFFLSLDDRKYWLSQDALLATESIDPPAALYVYQRVTTNDKNSHPEWTTALGQATVYDSTWHPVYVTPNNQVWRLLSQGVDWWFENGVLRLKRSGAASSGGALAAAWTGSKASGAHGRGGPGYSSVSLVLLYANDYDTLPLRRLQVRNRYYKLPTVLSTTDQANVKIRVLDLASTKGDNSVDSTGKDWAKVFGLVDDQGKINAADTKIFDWAHNALIFPGLEPFRRFGQGHDYDTLRTALSTSTARFAIEITAKSSSDSIKIGSRDYANVSGTNCVDIIQGSEVLTLNGSTKLQRGVDYDVQYQSGTITLLSPRARDASADIQVDYSCTPFFSLDNRTVAGARLEYQLPEISKESVLGATFLYRSETTTDNRPQLQREGGTSLLWGANMRLTGESEGLTEMASHIPLYKPKTESKWRLEVEGAQSWVDPNPSGYALVEDFESAQLNNEMPLNRTSWYQASPPGGNPSDANRNDTLDYRHQGELTWSSNGQVKLADIYPNHDDGTGAPAVQNVMNLRFVPNERSGAGMSWGGIMRATPSSYRDYTASRYLEVVVLGRGGELNFDFGDISEALSLDGDPPDDTLLRGENVDAKGIVHTSALNDSGLDGRGDKDEVVKVWTCFRMDCQDTTRTHDGDLDPAGDDYRADAISNDPDHSIDGTEGNNVLMGPGYFDTENLYGDGTLHTKNAYDRFRIVLGGAGATPYQTLRNGWRLYRIPLDKPFAKVGGGAVWSQINYVRMWVDGLSVANGANLLREKYGIARMALVGNQWRGTGHMAANDDTTVVDSTYSANWTSTTKVVSQDSSRLDVSVVGRTTDNANYVSWGVPVVKDQNTGAVQNEQSLRLVYKDLRTDLDASGKLDSGSALRTYESARDLTLYQNIALLAYHQLAYDPYPHGEHPVRFGVQIGSGDPTSASAPYYEYSFNPRPAVCPLGDQGTACANIQDPERRTNMQDNWRENEIQVPLLALTGLKTRRDAQHRSADTAFAQSYFPAGRIGDNDSILVKGDPTASQVTWMRFWVRPNARGPGEYQRVSGEIWVNDIQMSAPHRAFGSAGRASAQVNVSDLLDLSASTEYRGGDFVAMGQKEPTFANQKSSATATAAGRLSLDRFLPESWKAQLPVSGSVTGGVTRPWARPGSDQELTRDGLPEIMGDWWDNTMRRDSADVANRTSRAYQTMTVSRTVSASWSRARDEDAGVGAFLANTFTARPKLSWTYTEQGTLAPERRDSTWAHSLRLDYDLSPSAAPQLHPFGSATAKWVPTFFRNMAFQPWPTSIQTTLGDLDYLEGVHSVLAPDKDSLPRTWTHDRRANLTHAVSLDWPVLDFARMGFTERSVRLWDDFGQAGRFDPSTGLGGAFPLILDWDTTRVHSPGATGSSVEPQQFGLLRNENNRTATFSLDLSPRILPWFTTTGNYQSNGSAAREASTKRLDALGDTLSYQYWDHAHTDNFRASVRLDVPTVFRTLQDLLPDSWSKPIDGARQALDRWRWSGIGMEYSVDDRVSGIRQTLDYTSQSEGLNAASLQGWELGLGDGMGWRTPLDWVTGDRSKSGFGQYRPSRLDDPNYDPSTADLLAQNPGVIRSGQVNTRSYRISTNSEVTVPGLLLTLQPSLTYMVSWDERWASPWDVDTTRTWPQVGVNANLANFAGRIPLLSKWFESVTANHSTVFEHQAQIYPHSVTNDVDNYSVKWAPLFGFQARTKGSWTFDDRTNFSVTWSESHSKDPVTTTGVSGACPDSSLPYFFWRADASIPRCYQLIGTSWDRRYDVGNEGTATYRIQTRKGIQILKWFVKLDNDLVVTFKAGWTQNWETKNDYDRSVGDNLGTQTLKRVTTVYAGSNASYNFTSKLSANFDASYKRSGTKTTTDPSTSVANDISILASLQYKF
jgi:hypothetical protein